MAAKHDFNPRSPWGERPHFTRDTVRLITFQSTLPVGGATKSKARRLCSFYISIHAPRGGSDFSCSPSPRPCRNFNPRSPWGERPGYRCPPGTPPRFQSTLPVGGATVWSGDPKSFDLNFNPRSPWGERHAAQCRKGFPTLDFNPRSPWGERL